MANEAAHNSCGAQSEESLLACHDVISLGDQRLILLINPTVASVFSPPLPPWDVKRLR
jgi:hypothetical protein